MQIPPGLTQSGIDITDIHAAGKSGLAVHHHDLAVVAVVQRQLTAQGINGKKSFDPAARLHQPLEESPPGTARTHIIQQQSYLDTAASGSRQSISQTRARAIGLPDVVDQMYMVPRAVEGCFQGIKGRWTQAQQDHFVAGPWPDFIQFLRELQQRRREIRRRRATR